MAYRGRGRGRGRNPRLPQIRPQGGGPYTITPNAQACSDYTSGMSCISNGCYWSDISAPGCPMGGCCMDSSSGFKRGGRVRRQRGGRIRRQQGGGLPKPWGGK